MGFDPPGSTILLMSVFKFILAYIFSLLLLAVSVLGLTAVGSNFFQDAQPHVEFYVRLSAIFVMAISDILLWYYSSILSRNSVNNELRKLGLDVISLDFEKISKIKSQKLTEEITKIFENREHGQRWFLGVTLPSLTAFTVLFTIDIVQNLNLMSLYLVTCSTTFIVIRFISSALDGLSLNDHSSHLINILRSLPQSVKGIQFFESKNLVETKMIGEHRHSAKMMCAYLTKAVWKSFLQLSILFIAIILTYLSNQDFISRNLLNAIHDAGGIYAGALSTFVIFSASLIRVITLRKEKPENFERYRIEKADGSESTKEIDHKNLFIAFHGVYFQDPTNLSDHPIISNLSFSVLPGEFITITGENRSAQEYILDLILKFYRPQSGKIYIAGTKIESVAIKRLREQIGIFEEDFGLINETVWNNLEMVGATPKAISAAAKGVGLEGSLNKTIFDELGNLAISQQTLVRLQIARIAIKKPSVILIKTPETFESEIAEEIFYGFVNHHIKKHTVILVTNNPSFIVYSNKILYISSDGTSLFGNHAELSKDKTYQKFLETL